MVPEDWLRSRRSLLDLGGSPTSGLGDRLAPGAVYRPVALPTLVDEAEYERLDVPPGPFDVVVLSLEIQKLRRPGVLLRRARRWSENLIFEYGHPVGGSGAWLRSREAWAHAHSEPGLEDFLGNQGWSIAGRSVAFQDAQQRRVQYLCRRSELRRTFRLSPLAEQIRDERLTYLSVEKMSRLETALGQVGPEVRGAFCEFGVALGGSAVVIARRALLAGRRFLGFDVFGLIPEPTSPWDDAAARARYDVIASGKSQGIRGGTYYGYERDLLRQVTATFERYGLPATRDDVALIRGLFSETWPNHAVQIAFAHIDCDWYDSVMFALEASASRMEKGGIIVIDDYNDYSGARAATDQFVAGRDAFRLEQGANPFIRKIA